jgi:SAM-dependent methyltransferase
MNTDHIKRWIEPELCCDPEWEAAYSRFESRTEEENKFVGRLKRFGVQRWSRDLEVVDIFCGRGGGLKAWERLGFRHLEGVDLSESLLLQYSGPAKVYVGDCRRLALPDASRDVICVQGGLHHLPSLPEDLEAVIAEVHRVLRPGGIFIVVEPWRTPFLVTVHWLCRQPLLARLSPKVSALGTMIRQEQRTYFQWLSRPQEIKAAFSRGFRTMQEQISWGKMKWMGAKAPERFKDAGGLPAAAGAP